MIIDTARKYTAKEAYDVAIGNLGSLSNAFEQIMADVMVCAYNGEYSAFLNIAHFNVEAHNVPNIVKELNRLGYSAKFHVGLGGLEVSWDIQGD